MLGTRIGPYRFLRKIEEDALGEIFEAVDLGSKKPVAIRALPSEAAKRSQTIERLYSEAKTLALLNHPHIARTYGFIRRPDRLFLVGELIEGETLHTALKAKGRLELPVALAYVHQVLNAVAFAHSLGVIHGDLQPSNIVITHLGQVKVVDFAIALLLGDQDFQRPLPQSECYASPERRRREPIDERSDVYSVGAVLYACLTGHAPFAGEPVRADGRRLSTPLPPSMLAKNSPSWLDSVTRRALAEEPSDRFRDAASMVEAINRVVKLGPKAKFASRRWGAPTWVPAPSKLFAARSLRRARDTALHPIWAAAEHAWQRRESAAHRAAEGFAKLRCAGDRAAASMRAGLHAGAESLKEARRTLENSFDVAGPAMRRRGVQTAASMREIQRQLRTALRDKLPLRRDLTRVGNRAPRLKFGFGESGKDWLRHRFARLSETSWQRYAALAVVLTAALIEIFAFGGANTLLAPDRLQIGDAPRNGAAESFLEPIPERVVPQTTVAPTASNDVGTPGTVKRESVERKPPAVARATADHDPDHRRARVARRVVTYRTESQPLRPVDPRPTEPVPSRKAGDTNAQLNVKWEN